MSTRSIIRRFGGVRKMARKLGHRNHTTVQGWWIRDLIPAQRQAEVLDAAAAHSLEVDAADLIQPRVEQEPGRTESAEAKAA